MSALAVTSLGKRYRLGEREVVALDGVGFTLAAGRCLAVTGPSGSGKSTLLGLLAGLDAPSSGRVVVEGQDLAGLDGDALAAFRGRRMGFVFQSYRLLGALTALENVQVPLELAGHRDARERARTWLERLGLGERLDHRPSRLSGGEQQRVAVARAMAPDPAVLLADEPTGNLDRATGVAITELLFALVRDNGTAMVLATHDLDLAERADDRLALVDGRAVCA